MTLPPSIGAAPYRVVMVCLGNICRSPIAAAVLDARLAETGLDRHVVVDSAGTGSWHIGEQADPRARSALARHGYDGDSHRARQFEADWFGDRDLVVAMDHDNARTLRRLAPDDAAAARVVLLRSFDPGLGRDDDRQVADPYYGDERGFDDVLGVVERAVDGLVEALSDRLLPPRS